MLRVKMLVGLVGIFATLALSASPAFAEWQAKGQSKGVVKIKSTGEFVYAENDTVKCPTKGNPEAEWSIQTKGPINEHEVGEKQKQTKTGPHLWIKVTKWGTECTATLGAIKAAAEVKPCEFQLVQLRGETKATAGVGSECIIKASACEIKVAQGKESTNENVGLPEVELKNEITSSGTNQNDESKVMGVTATTNGGLCPLVKTTKAAELLGLSFQLENVAAI
jgi:hypothetical protein